MKVTDPDYPRPSSQFVTRVMKSNKRSNTGPEKALRSELHRLGYRFRKDKQVWAGARKCRPDIVFSAKKIAVFVDGCYWHRCPKHSHPPKANRKYWKKKFERNLNRDRLDTLALLRAGWKVIRIWEHEIPTVSVKKIIRRLASRAIS